MFAKALELERIEPDGAGGVTLWFDDAGAKRPCRLPLAVTGAVLGAIAKAQADADGVVALGVEQVMLRNPADPGEPPVLGVWPARWPPLALALTWPQVRALSKLAEGALQAAKRPRGRRH